MEEQNNVLQDYTEFPHEYASAGIRLLNYIIDLIAFYILSALVGFIIGLISVATKENYTEQNMSRAGAQIFFFVIFVVLYIIYYTVFEGAKGKTLGKLITKTRVLTEDGSPITFKQAFLRSLCRMVPFEPLSALFGLKMWHDQWTKTIVVKDRKVY